MIYSQSDDSYLMQEVLKEYSKKFFKNPNYKILEIGAGSGILAKTLIELKIKRKNIFLTDIDKKTIQHLRKNFKKVNIIKSDLFKKIPKQKFDLIIFNPPYLPEDELEDKESRRATTGGKYGSEIINRFLIQSKSYLTKNGNILLLTSSLTKRINLKNFRKKKIAEKKIFFETLFVWKLHLTHFWK